MKFSCSANGSTPLNFQWQRNMADISGAMGTSYAIQSVTAADNGALFRCVATNAFGSAFSNNATLTVPSNQPPSPVITAPAAGTFYNAGDTINYAGTATDNEDSSIPPSAFTWSVVFHHDTHTHPFIPPTSGSTFGTFTIPTVGETAANVWYRIHLVVTDSGGLATEVTRDIFPNTVTLNFTTNPAGLSINLDGQQHADGYSELNVVNMQRALGVPSPQTLNGVVYSFASWSDGGSQTHNINVPASNTTSTANFVRAPNAGDMLISEFRLDGPNGTSDEFLELYNNTNMPIIVNSTDGSPGWAVALAYRCALCDPSGHAINAYVVIPSGTVIPARGHFLYTSTFTDSPSVYRGYDFLRLARPWTSKAVRNGGG
ncbi:MAG: immunoglobulin domain-containing protein [bacterium]